MDLTEGEPVAIRFTKWDGTPHWAYDGRYLGDDEHGRWVAVPAGAALSRPGRQMVAEWDGVLCFPRESMHVLTTNLAPHHMRHYVDICTVPHWHRVADVATVSMVDLDLDVIQMRDGRVILDDEDEFFDHQVDMGYPPELVHAASSEARRILGLVEAHQEPFRTDAEEWLEQVSD